MTLAIDIQGLKKTYANKTVALDGIDLAVEEGDFFALLGPNGAGKSTTIGIITSLLKPTEGTIRLFGKPMSDHLTEIKRLIGVVPQEFNFSIFETPENILYTQAGYYGFTRQEVRERVNYLLEALGLWEKRHKKASSLSGGMKRRLMIARALVHRPKLLILDEPTAGVDIELRRSMWDFLQKLNEEGTTIILTTHYLEEAEQLCRHVAIINQGKIVIRGATRTLLRELESQTILLDVEQPLNIAPDLGDCMVNLIDQHTLEVTLPKDQHINQLFERLNQAGIHVISFRNKENRLESLFLRLTQGVSHVAL